MKKPKALLFDLGDTILHEIRFDPEAGNSYLYSIINDTKNVSCKTISDQIAKLNEEITPKKNAACFEVSWVAFNRLVFEFFDLALSIPFEEAEREFCKRAYSYVPAPNIAELLDYVKNLNIPMGVVSNSVFSGSTLSWELEKHGLRSCFEFVLSSADYGLRKPHPYLFKVAASKINAAPDEIWFAGDNIEWDVHGSKNAGMIPFYYIGKTGEADSTENEIIRNWNEMVELLRNAED